MAKATLEFDIHEEAEELNDAINGRKWKSVVWEIDQELRKEVKYNENLPEVVHDAYSDFRDRIRRIVSEHGLELG
jgi:hypothetical protein